jgi:hypothetical protein
MMWIPQDLARNGGRRLLKYHDKLAFMMTVIQVPGQATDALLGFRSGEVFVARWWPWTHQFELVSYGCNPIYIEHTLISKRMHILRCREASHTFISDLKGMYLQEPTPGKIVTFKQVTPHENGGYS